MITSSCFIPYSIDVYSQENELYITFLEGNSSSSVSPCSHNFLPIVTQENHHVTFPHCDRLALTAQHRWLEVLPASSLPAPKLWVGCQVSVWSTAEKSLGETLFYRTELKHLTLLNDGTIIVLLSEFQRNSVEWPFLESFFSDSFWSEFSVEEELKEKETCFSIPFCSVGTLRGVSDFLGYWKVWVFCITYDKNNCFKDMKPCASGHRSAANWWNKEKNHFPVRKSFPSCPWWVSHIFLRNDCQKQRLK